jgi:signal transduction histidine kinase
LLVLCWLIIVAWQTIEHFRVRKSERTALVTRGRDITTTLGVVIRSLRRGEKERVESTLRELVNTGDLRSIALLNRDGDIVASVGDTNHLTIKSPAHGGQSWDAETVTLVNLMDFGTNTVQEGAAPGPTMVYPPRPNDGATNSERRGSRGSRRSPGATNEAEGDRRRGPPPDWNFRNGPRSRFLGKPFWMSDEEYQALIAKQGVHSFVVVMSTDQFRQACRQDLWLRFMIGALGGVAVGGLALAWRSFTQYSQVQLRLVRASELNNHLKQTNIAAAGLAHETRNPLNIIRGLAQMISKQTDAPPEIRRKAGSITEEADRVTAQLNEFINYSKPREVRQGTINPSVVVSEVVRALECDLEEKSIRLNVSGENISIEADEQLLRQALFNLLLNAVQALESGGAIEVAVGRSGPDEAYLEVRDNGPGVPPGQRLEVFKPYFTTHQRGTGLGLAVVQQIVLAHGWEIECLGNEPKGALFRISRLKLTGTA